MEADLIERLAMDAMLTAPIAPTAGDGVRITCSCGEDATAFVRRFAALLAEECARIAEPGSMSTIAESTIGGNIAAAIRAKFPPP